jgi:hypothetical protein
VEQAQALIDRCQVHASAIEPLLRHALQEDIAAGRQQGRQIAASRGSSEPVRAVGELSDSAAGELFPPRSREAAEARFRRAEQITASIARLDDAELHSRLFGSRVFEAAAAPHEAYDGQHAHLHTDLAGGQHAHLHTHADDANHSTGQHLQEPPHSQVEQGR